MAGRGWSGVFERVFRKGLNFSLTELEILFGACKDSMENNIFLIFFNIF